MRTFTVVKLESSDNYLGAGKSSETEELLACRVCLATDTILFSLHEKQLAQTFGDLTGTPVLATDGLPQHICGWCNSLLQKSSAFRTKCRRTHLFLQDARVHTPLITTQYIRTINRAYLKPPLITTNVLTLDFIPTEDSKADEKDLTDREVEVERIKKENFVELPPLDDDYGNLHVYLDDTADDFLNIDDGDGKIIAEEIKLENEFMFKSNTEGYSLRQTRKRKKDTEKSRAKKEKSSSKRVKKVKKENVEIEPEPEKVRKKPEPKKKRMYNRKTEEDFVAFGKTFNVEVLFLTREQQLQEVQSRRESDDYLSARFQCDMCYKSFMKESAYKKHMDTHDPSSGSHVCDICYVRFSVRHKLMKHLRRHKIQFICKFCNQISKDSTMAKMHFKWHEGFKYDCQHCGKKFNKPSSYMNHVRENHSAVTCDICQEAVSGTRGLAAHKTIVHSEAHKCPSCGSQFHAEAALMRHREISTHGCDPCLRPCPQCGDNFITADLLHDHLEKQHKDKIFRCDQCNTTYSSDRQLGIHWTRAHKGQRRRQGSAPGRATHDGDFMCEVCAKSYPSETTLRYHQRVHTGERPFQCPMCPKRFRMKTNLQVHINTHTGARPYKCLLCPETFKSYSQKHKHRLLVHTKERRHKCSMCEKTYVVSFDLKMHIRTVHMKIPLPPRARRRRPAAQPQTQPQPQIAL